VLVFGYGFGGTETVPAVWNRVVGY
jgi:hypothetical protein